jgi:hypothetical protein
VTIGTHRVQNRVTIGTHRVQNRVTIGKQRVQNRVTIGTHRVQNNTFARFSYFFYRGLIFKQANFFMVLPFFAPFAHFLEISTIMRVGRESSAEIATRYELDGPGIKSWYGLDFPLPSRQALRPAQVQWVSGLFRRYSSRGVALTTHPVSIDEVKKRVELYLNSPLELHGLF